VCLVGAADTEVGPPGPEREKKSPTLFDNILRQQEELAEKVELFSTTFCASRRSWRKRLNSFRQHFAEAGKAEGKG
jgi:hypothetical protein